jgi:hypothetical protein
LSCAFTNSWIPRSDSSFPYPDILTGGKRANRKGSFLNVERAVKEFHALRLIANPQSNARWLFSRQFAFALFKLLCGWEP